VSLKKDVILTYYYIEVNNLDFAYATGAFAIKGLNIALEAGVFTALIGANGSGKSTLAKLIAGVLSPHSGSLYLDGQDTSRLSLGQRGRKLGYLMQNPAAQIFAPTVAEELSFIPRLLGHSPQSIKTRREELLDFFDLAGREEESVFHLSLGEKQRLALAGVLFTPPPYLLLDEPTWGLDPENKSHLAGLLDKLLKQGTGLTVISHDRNFLDQFEGRHLRMEEGQVYEE